MTPRLLPEPLTGFRIGDPDGEWPIFSAGGTRLSGGRWHATGDPVIYASVHYSTAMLEKLVRTAVMPPNQHFIEITVPASTSYEIVTGDTLPGWHEMDCQIARNFGHHWYLEKRSAVLIVPSVVARMEQNLVINTAHPDFQAITAGLETPVWWDQRLFA